MDYNRIKLTDTGIFSRNNKFHNIFHRFGITTVAQVLDEDLMFDIYVRAQTRTRTELKGFVSLIRYQYLGIPFANDDFLDSPLGYTVDKSGNVEIPGLQALGFNIAMRGRMKYLTYIALNEKALDEKSTFIECLKLFTTEPYLSRLNDFLQKTENGYFLNLINLYLDYYSKVRLKKKEIASPSDAITKYKEEIARLIAERDSIDNKIVNLQKEIDILEAREKRGR